MSTHSGDFSPQRLRDVWAKFEDPDYYQGLRIQHSSPVVGLDGGIVATMPSRSKKRSSLDQDGGDRPMLYGARILHRRS